MSDEMEKITQNIQRAIRCPVCYGLTIDFNYVCENGHVVCRACVNGMLEANRSDSCPTCRARPISGSPMMSLLRLIYANLSVACVNRVNGCQVITSILVIKQHETHCAYIQIPTKDNQTDST